MKIAYYTEVNLKDNDGPAINELEFINSLSSLNESKYLIFIKDYAQIIYDIPQKNFYFLDPTPKISQFCKWIRRFININKKIKAERVKLLVCRLTDYPLIPLLIKIFNPKVKLAIKTAALWWVGRNVPKGLKDKIYYFLSDTITKIVYKKADVIDVAMIETRDALIRLRLTRKEKIHLIDNAINIEMFKPIPSLDAKKKLNIPKNAIVLGFAGSLPSQRGAYQILQVAEKLDSVFSNLYVLIVGYDKNLTSLIKESKFPKEKIILPGLVSYSEIPFYLSATTVCYSFFESHKLQKTGNASQKVKQYIAMGKPVISVATGHLYLKENSLGSPVNQDNIEEVIQETIKWIKHIESEKDHLAQRLHQYASAYLSTKKTFQQRLEFWNSLFKN
jgi:glycosyltransferase involved in cell wall biosynthesis